MPQGDPRPFEPPTTLPDSVIYDIFADTATRLGGKYIHLADEADSPEHEEYWIKKSVALRDEKQAVTPGNRAVLVEHINRWLTELEEHRKH